MKDKLSMEQAEELRRALDLTQVPDAVNRKLRQVYAELPEEVPHKSRWREPLLKAAGVFAALAVVCGGLLGLNAANPALAESIPGLGSLFALMNDHTMHPMGSHVGTYVDHVEELDLTADAPADTDYELTLDEAFCDGSYVYLTLRVAGPEEAEQYESLNLMCDGKSDFRLLVDGAEAELFTLGEQTQADGTEAFALVHELASPVENGQEVSARLEVGSLYGLYPQDDSKSGGWQYDTLEVGFTADFTVTADTSQNRSEELSAEDNGVKLYGIKTTPGYLLVDMEIPFWGRTGDPTASGGGILGYAQLFTQDGQELHHNSQLNDYDFENESDAESIRGTWAFDGPPEQTDTVILRILDRVPDSYYSGAPEQPVVFAEFAINWKTGEARPSDTYLDEGLSKMDTEEFQASWGPADFTGGYLVSDILNIQDMWHGTDDWICMVQLWADVEYQPIELRYYNGERLLGTVKAAPESAYNDNTVADGVPAYRGEDGFFLGGKVTNPNLAQEAKYDLIFCLLYPEDSLEETEYGVGVDISKAADRIQLVNSETGQVLLDDLEIGQAYSPEQ